MYFDPGDKQSLTAKVYGHIRDGIIDGTYTNGELLREISLAEKLGVSRTPVREALKQLELEGLVTSIPNRGVVVKGLSEADVLDIFVIRRLLEGQAAYWAAVRITQKQLDRLTEVLELLELYTRKNDVPQIARWDTEFHDVIYTASNSRILKQILASLHQNIRMARRSSLNVPARPMESLTEHQAIFAALERHDGEEAKCAMERHVGNVHSCKD